MEKPTRPRKPKKIVPREPDNILKDYFYPMGDYCGSKVLRVFTEEELICPYYDDDHTDEERRVQEEFYDNNSFLSKLSILEIMEFAEKKEIPLAELHVEANSDSGDEDGHCILLWERKIPDEAFQDMLNAHEAEKIAGKERYETALVEYAAAKEQYKVDKAAYDVYLAQQKLNALQGNS